MTEISSPGRSTVRDRWIAWLFIIGSSLFALGAVPLYAEAVGLRLCAATFFVGSLFFTCAAFLQYREAVDALPAVGATRRHSFWVWAPRNLGWLAGAIQLAGTLWFNWSTGNALRVNLSAALTEQLVWRPDALGVSRLPRFKRCGVAGCRSRRHRRPAQDSDVEDRRDQRGRLCCVRHLGCRGLCHTVERRCLERRAVQSRHTRGSPVLPHRRDSDAESRIRRRLGSSRPGNSSVTPFQQSLKEK